MSLRLSFQIAKTHLFTRFRQSLIAVLGVTFGIAMFIAMVGLMTGLNDLTRELSMTSTPDIRIYRDIAFERKSILEEVYPEAFTVVHHQKPKDEVRNLSRGFQIVELLQKDPRILGVSPQLTSQVFYNYGPVQLNGSLVGVNVMDEDLLFDLKSKVKAGRLEDLMVARDAIMMGSGLAKKLNAHVGDRVTISTPEGFTMKLKVVAIFQMGLGVIDDVRSYTSISTVQKVLQVDKKYITDIHVKLKDYLQAREIAPELLRVYGYDAVDWETTNATLLVGETIRNILTYSVSITLLVVAGFGIYNIMNMTIYNKMRDIAILKATGFAGHDVLSVFMIESLVIGFLGSSLGLAIGFGISYAIAQVPFDTGGVIAMDHLPVNFKPVSYLTGIVFGMVTTGIAGYLPAKKAAGIDPIEIIRGQ
jgi:lipoprotein-releasing system permease protein